MNSPRFELLRPRSLACGRDLQRLSDTAAYLARNPLSLKKLVYLDGQQAVLYRAKMNPFLGPNFETLFYGEYANRLGSASAGRG